MSMLGYTLAQQVLRMGANDPQIQMAEDTASALANGAAVSSLLSAPPVDVGQSLAPFVIVYDEGGQPVASSGLLHGRTPEVPPGVLAAAKRRGENRVTWQPEPGVRIASVTVYYSGARSGWVLAGRSLREVEARASNLLLLAGLAMIATLASSLVVVTFGELVLSDDRGRT